MDYIIEVKNLVKQYNGLTAVNGISFAVPRGKLFAFLGPNGAGKSTTINILCTLLQKNQGDVTIAGLVLDQHDEEIRRKIGVVFQENMLDGRLSVSENLMGRGRLYYKNDKIGLATRYQEVIDFFQLKDIEKKRFDALSGGQKRRVEIARALISQPDILFLDEPTTGLDPETRIQVWKTIDRLRKTYNTTIFLTTHYMEEAANADLVVVINRGNIIAEGTPAKLKEEYSYDTLRFVPKDKAKALKYLALNQLDVIERADILQVKLKNTLNALALLDYLRDNMQSFEVVKGNMDDVFVNIIQGDYHG